MGVLNNRASADSRFARTGKDGALYDENGVLMATVDTFTAQTSINNAQYTVLGNPLELETLNTHGHTLTFSHVVIEDDRFISALMDFFHKGIPVNMKFQGVIKGDNGSQERIVYPNCIPSGQIDLQNVTTGDTIKRSWSWHVNGEPKLQKKLTIN